MLFRIEKNEKAKNEIKAYFKEHPDMLERYVKALMEFDDEKLIDICIEASKGLSAETIAYTTFYMEILSERYSNRITENEELYEKMKKVTEIYEDLEDERLKDIENITKWSLGIKN